MDLVSLRQKFSVVDEPGDAWDFHDTVFAPRVRSRIDVRYLVLRRWGADKGGAVVALREAKRTLDPETVGRIAGEIADLVTAVHGKWNGCVVPVACGHSRRRDGMSFRIGQAVAERLDADFVEAFEFRPVSGSSHPKQFDKIPPITVLETPTSPALVVDDVATSGWHMREALNALRERSVQSSGMAWIGN